MKNLPNFQFYHNKDSKQLDVVMHGISQGIDSRFMTKIINAARVEGNSVVAFNFEYLDRGETKSSGNELIEERATLQKILDYSNANDFDNIRLIGKSLGGIVLARYLKDLKEEVYSKFSAIIFGYVVGDIDIKTFTGAIRIIHGSRDKFGDINAVKKDLDGARSEKIDLIEIEGASHSYCNPENDEPIYEDEAIRKGFNLS